MGLSYRSFILAALAARERYTTIFFLDQSIP